MLLSLSLKNFAIIDTLNISFHGGLNIVTGDTGAGKSIIVDAISIINGAKASPDYIRSGEKEAHIEAVFDIANNNPVKETLSKYGIIYDADLIIKRVISNTGKNRIFANGSNITLSMLNDISDNVIDIFGQHENKNLLDVENHIDILDQFGVNENLLEQVFSKYKEISILDNKIGEIINKSREKKEREDFLKFQCNEIEKASLDVNEEDKLENERRILLNYVNLNSYLLDSYNNLYENENSISAMLNKILTNLQDAKTIDNTLEDTSNILENTLTQLEEVSYTLRDYINNIESDPDRLEFIENRLQQINNLKRKYNCGISEILEKLKSYKKELEVLDSIETRIDELKSEHKRCSNEYRELCDNLSHKRRNESLKFSLMIENELNDVGIKDCRFVIRFDQTRLSSKGTDKVEFYFSSNPDEDVKPLSKVVSGGELSRIMLVIKSILSRDRNQSIIIFDEPDTGIGGAVAESVGTKIKNLSNDYQILCVTHLAQVAKFADYHISVKKEHIDKITKVSVNLLSDEQRVDELARMMGGITITEKTIDAAREMIRH